MSAKKTIDVRLYLYLMVVVQVVAALLGCSPRAPDAPTIKTKSTAENAQVAGSSPAIAPTTDNSLTNSRAQAPSEEFAPVPSEAEQLQAPTDALALRQEAKQLADELVSRFPNNPDALEIQARFLMLFGETEDAKNCWLAAIKVDPNYAYALHGLGKVAILNSDFDQAITYLKESIPKQAGNADPVHDLSDAYVKLGRLDDSIECLRVYADNNPQSALTFLLLGQSYLAQERFEEAEVAFRKVLQISPGQPRAENGLATVLVRLGRRDEAKPLLANQKAIRKASEKNRSPEEVFQDELKELSTRFHTVAEFYSTNGNLRRAEQVARRALVLNPNNIKPKALLVDMLQKQDRLKESLALAEQLCAEDQENPSWPYTCGALLSLLGDRNAARQAYEQVVKLAPRNPIGYEALARLAIGTRADLKSAIQNAQKTVEVRGSAADYELLAQAYAVNSDFPNAHQSLSDAIRLDPANKGYRDAMKQLQSAMESRSK
jgi:Flp pilus assembly protein TadD